ncbi:MAG: substrate-binding domain-containing protein [Tannerella sp.]|jgi:ABC-type phosphate transport system substrate-binding protein|nr:substrate-binding domain-containing protein [Tannerella sp.]
MKKYFYLILLLFTFISVKAADENSKQNIIYIKSVNFALPLIKQWISEYAKVNPNVHIVVADKDTDTKEIDIQISISDAQTGNLYENQFYSSVGRYAILPITGKNNVLLNDLNKKRLNSKRLKELYFEKEIDFDNDASSKEKYNATVYSGYNSSSVTQPFAVHFGFEPSKLKGKKISGDDIYLVNAVQKDETGVSFNNLNYLYDLNSRQLKKEIAILPLDLKKEYSTILEESNLDKLIDLLEEKSIELIPVEEIGFVFQNQVNPEVKNFLQWILSEGQAYNHQFGFLNLDEKTLNQQKEQVENRLLTYKK